MLDADENGKLERLALMKLGLENKTRFLLVLTRPIA